MKTKLDLKKLLNSLPAGAKITIETPEGDVIVQQTPTKADIINTNYAGLVGAAITVTDAAEKYDVGRRTILEWKKNGYITVLKDGYRMELDEADVAYCAGIYNERTEAGIGYGAPLLDDAGLPYQLKRPGLAKYRKKRRKETA